MAIEGSLYNVHIVASTWDLLGRIEWLLFMHFEHDKLRLATPFSPTNHLEPNRIIESPS